MMDAVKATAGLAMSTFKDKSNGEEAEKQLGGEEPEPMLSNWKPTPDLKKMWMKPKGGE